ncbi:hypothetical protein MVUOKPPV_CDS0227 [Klebsiella phage phi1_175008]|uniref:Uncharacterized protein n=2 Tax=Klebsiella phage phi1_175008 TaxID=3127744 RepID=A0ACD5FS27_9CAUD
MSKRFGRNQKRKMRESLAAQEKQLNNLQRDLDNSRNENRMERECLQMTCDLLGEYFPTLMPQTREVPYGSFSVPSYGLFNPTPYEMRERIMKMELTLHRLESIEYDIEVDKLREMLYLRVYTPNGGSVAYNWQFRKLPSHIMEQILQRDLVPMLVEEIKRGLNG